MRPFRALPTPLAALTVAACASGAHGPSPEQAVRAVVNRYTVDIGTNDFKDACALTSGSFRTSCEFVARLGGINAVGSFCSSAGGNATQCQSLSQNASATAALVISKVVVTGQTAWVAFAGQSFVMRLARENGVWRVVSD